MHAKPYIEALAKELNVAIELSESGAAFLSWDGMSLLLQWVASESCFLIYAELGRPVGWRDGELFRQLLSANFLLAQTEGGSLSWHAGTNVIGINFPLPVYGLDGAQFIHKFNTLLLTASRWKGELASMLAMQEHMASESQKKVLAQEEYALASDRMLSNMPAGGTMSQATPPEGLQSQFDLQSYMMLKI